MVQVLRFFGALLAYNSQQFPKVIDLAQEDAYSAFKVFLLLLKSEILCHQHLYLFDEAVFLLLGREVAFLKVDDRAKLCILCGEMMRKGINRVHSPISKNKNNYSFINVYARVQGRQARQGSLVLGLGNGVGWVCLKGKGRVYRFFNLKDNKILVAEFVISIKHRIFVARFGVKSITTMAKKTSDTVALKKPLTAFFLYRAEIFDDVKLKNPKLKPTELASLIGEMWKKSDSETRTRFEEEYKANKAIFDKQRKALAEEKSEETEEEKEVKAKKAQKKKKSQADEEGDFDEDEQDEDEEYDASIKTKKKSTKKAPVKKEITKAAPKNAKKPVPKKGSKATNK